MNDLERLSTIGEPHYETVTCVYPEMDDVSLFRKLVLEHQYRVIRCIDIAAPFARMAKNPQIQRGSWVDALTAIDSDLVDYDECDTP